jgi:Ca2+-binding EF-hand superfamily protein
VYKRFIAIDSDLDGRISFNETVHWFSNKEPVGSELATNQTDREEIYLEFKKMDTNNNNFIETNEFDRDLQ